MPNTREKLIELLGAATFGVNKQTIPSYLPNTAIGEVADHLIANGVTINRGTEYTPVGDKLSPTDKDINVLINADRIRAMSDDELAEFISSCGCPDHARSCRASCTDCTLEWLKQTAEEQ